MAIERNATNVYTVTQKGFFVDFSYNRIAIGSRLSVDYYTRIFVV